MAQVDHATCEQAVCNDGYGASQAGSFEMEDKPSGASSFTSTEQRTSFDSTASSAGASSSPYFSTRCQSMMQRRTEFPSELDFKIQVSKEHWSELSTVEDRCAARKKPVPLRVVIARGFGKAFLGRKIVAEEEDDATTTPELHSTESLERTREVFEELERTREVFEEEQQLGALEGMGGV